MRASRWQEASLPRHRRLSSGSCPRRVPQFPHLQREGKALGPSRLPSGPTTAKPGGPRAAVLAASWLTLRVVLQKMGMTEDDKRNCCLLEIQETEAKYYRTLEDIEKVGGAAAIPVATGSAQGPWGGGCHQEGPQGRGDG